MAAALDTDTPPPTPGLSPGECAGDLGGPLLRYLTALESFDRRFPGFRSETHGVTLDADTGDYLIECLRPETDEAECLRPETDEALSESRAHRASAPAQRRGPEAARPPR